MRKVTKMDDMQSYFDDYPEALRKAKFSNGITLTELAKISGVPYNSICSVNSGATKQPLLYYSAATCKALGLSLDQLFGLSSDNAKLNETLEAKNEKLQAKNEKLEAKNEELQGENHNLEIENARQDEAIKHLNNMNAVRTSQVDARTPLIYGLLGLCSLLLCVVIGYILFDIRLRNAGLFVSSGMSLLAGVLVAVVVVSVALIVYTLAVVIKYERNEKRPQD